MSTFLEVHKEASWILAGCLDSVLECLCLSQTCFSAPDWTVNIIIFDFLGHQIAKVVF